MFRARGHPDFRERLVHAFAPLLRRQPAVSQRQFDVLPDRQIPYKVEALENEADLAVAEARALGMVELCHRLAAQYVTAARGRIEQAKNGEQGGFAATRRPGDGHVIAVAD